jgi:hypothetical protein
MKISSRRQIDGGLVWRRGGEYAPSAMMRERMARNQMRLAEKDQSKTEAVSGEAERTRC